MSNRHDLPDDIESLQRLVTEPRAIIEATRAPLLAREVEIEKLRIELARLKRMQFGRSSEQLDAQIAQLELTLEDAEARQAALPPRPVPVATELPAKPARRPLPAHLPREETVHSTPCACPACGGELRSLGEDVSEMIEYVPERYKVIRHVRPCLPDLMT